MDVKPRHLISVGLRHGFLTVTGAAGYNVYGCRMFTCRCDCGADVTMRATHFYETRRYCTRKCPLLSKQKVADLSGSRFGRWVVVSSAGTDGRGDAIWNCSCDCGTEKEVRGFMLSGGDSKSCGCAQKEALTIYHTPEEKLAGKRRASSKCARKNPARMKANKIKYDNKLSSATPPWLTQDDWEAMNAVYQQSREMTRMTGIRHEVDHIIPINGKTVSGLHVPLNLQILTQSANVSKSNRYAELMGDHENPGIKSPGREHFD
jgi:hypothetical protein